MKTLCFKIEEKLLHDLKVQVAARGQSMQQYMNTLIRQTLASPEEHLQDITLVRAELDQLRSRIDEIDTTLQKEQERLAARDSGSDE